MADSILRAIIEGNATGAIAAFRETAAASEATGATVVKSGEKAAAGAEAQSAAGVGSLAKITGALGPWGMAAGVATIAVLAVGGAATEMASKYDDATSRMAASANLTKEEAKKIGDAFLTTGGQTVFSAQQMMTAYAPIAGQLDAINGGALTTSQSLSVMKASTALASASGTDLTTATATLSATLQAFHQPISAAAADTDILFNASKTVAMPIGDFEAGIAKLHGRMGDLGGSLPEISTMFVDMAEHGVTGKTALTALTGATNTLLDSTDKNREAQDKAEQAYGKAQTALDRLQKSHKATAEQIADAKAKVLEAKTNMDDLAKGAGEMGLKVYDAGGNFVGMHSIIEQLQPKLAGMTQEQRRAAENAIFGAGAFDKLDSTIMAGASGWNKASDAVNKHGSAQDAASKATDNLKGSMDKIHGAFSNVMVTVGQHLLPVFDKLMGFAAQGVTWFAQKLPGALDFLGKAFNVIGPIIGKVAEVFITSWQIAFNIIGTAIGVFVNVFKAVEPVVAGVIGGIVSVIQAIIPPVQAVVGVIATVFGAAFKVISTVIGTEIGIATNIIKGIVGVVSTVVGTIGAVFNTIGSIVSSVFDGISRTIGGIIKGIIDIVRGVINVPINVVNGVIDAIDGIQVHVPSWVPGIGGKGWDGLGIGHIPKLDTGGIVEKEGFAYLHSAEVVVNPAQQTAAAAQHGRGGGVVIQQLIVQGGDPNAVVRALKQYERQNGSIPIKVAS